MKKVSYLYIERTYAIRALEVFERDIGMFASRYNVPGMDFDDVAQDLRIQLWRKLDKYDPTKAGLRKWSWMVMGSRVKDLLRMANKKNKDMLNTNVLPFIEEEETLELV